jgi:hypothetical protein
MKYIIGHTDRLGRTFWRAWDSAKVEYCWQPFESKAEKCTAGMAVTHMTLADNNFFGGLEIGETLFIKRVE